MSQTCIDKFNSIKNTIQNGDIILFHNDKLLGSKIISWCDNNAYFTHIGIIFKSENTLFLNQSEVLTGVGPAYLEKYIKNHDDFAILRPTQTNLIVDALTQAIQIGEQGITYDYAGGIRGMVYRKFGIDLKLTSPKDSDICSEFVQTYTNLLNMTEYENIKLIFPQDYIRYINPNNLVIFVPPLI